MPLVTVLMPVYNAERFLKEAMDSILQQTLTDFEFLIVDDGSKDNSAAIIRSYNDPRIRLVQNERNLGISATLNKGIELASCELIARMDADDISYPQRLQKQYDYLSTHPECALLSTWSRYMRYEKNTSWIDKHKAEHYYYSLIFNCWIFHPSVMYRRSAVIEVGMYSKPHSEDFNLWWKLSRKYKIHNLPEVLLDYRSMDTSLCKVTKKKEYEDEHDKQISDNIKYYTGDKLKLNFNDIQFFRGRMEPILKENNRKRIIQNFKNLDYITACVERTENVNKTDNKIIREAGYIKKLHLWDQLSLHKSNLTIALMIMELGDWKLLRTKLEKMVTKRTAKVIQLFNRLLANKQVEMYGYQK